MADTTWADLVTKDPDAIFKALGGGAAFVAPMTSTFPAALTAGAGGVLQELPAGYVCLGHLDKSGAVFGRETENSDVLSWGEQQPTRRDVISDVHTCQVIAQETNIQTLALDLNCLPEDLVADGTTGEVTYDDPGSPASIYNRLIVIARDVRADGEVYFARGWPRAQVTLRAGQQYQDGEDQPIQYDLTFTAFRDAVEQTAIRYWFGGPGWKALGAQLGFGAESSSASSSSSSA